MVRASLPPMRALAASAGADVVYTEAVVAKALRGCTVSEVDAQGRDDCAVLAGGDEGPQPPPEPAGEEPPGQRFWLFSKTGNGSAGSRGRPVLLLEQGLPPEPSAASACPVIVQLAAADLESLSAAVELIGPYCSGIDLNFGCTKDFAAQGGMGARMLGSRELMARMVRDARRLLPPGRTVSAKIRLLGTTGETADLVEALGTAGASAVAIHCRRAEDDRDKVEADWDEFFRVTEECCRRFARLSGASAGASADPSFADFPSGPGGCGAQDESCKPSDALCAPVILIANGGLILPEDILRFYRGAELCRARVLLQARRTGCDLALHHAVSALGIDTPIMLARGALRNPGIFSVARQIRGDLEAALREAVGQARGLSALAQSESNWRAFLTPQCVEEAFSRVTVPPEPDFLSYLRSLASFGATLRLPRLATKATLQYSLSYNRRWPPRFRDSASLVDLLSRVSAAGIPQELLAALASLDEPQGLGHCGPDPGSKPDPVFTPTN